MITRVITTLSPQKHAELLEVVWASVDPVPATQDGCLVVKLGGRISANKKGYVQISVRTPGDSCDPTSPNQKVQLHQLVAWNAPDADSRQRFREAITHAAGATDFSQVLEISHLCREKRCCNPGHLVAEPCVVNKSRNHCPVIVYVNDEEVPHCKHSPQCLPGQLRETALTITVITGKDGNVELLEWNWQ